MTPHRCWPAGGSPSVCRNYQELKVQEQVQRLAMGTIPRSMWVSLQDDLVDICKPGDDLTIWFVKCTHTHTNLVPVLTLNCLLAGEFSTALLNVLFFLTH